LIAHFKREIVATQQQQQQAQEAQARRQDEQAQEQAQMLAKMAKLETLALARGEEQTREQARLLAEARVLPTLQQDPLPTDEDGVARNQGKVHQEVQHQTEVKHQQDQQQEQQEGPTSPASSSWDRLRRDAHTPGEPIDHGDL
jgi:hypothetical protein